MFWGSWRSLSWPHFFETQSFISVFTQTCHCDESWATLIQFKPIHTTYLRYVSIFFSHLRLCLKIFHAYPHSSVACFKLCLFHSAWFSNFTILVLSANYEAPQMLISPSFCYFLPLSLSAPFLKHHRCTFINYRETKLQTHAIEWNA